MARTRNAACCVECTVTHDTNSRTIEYPKLVSRRNILQLIRGFLLVELILLPRPIQGKQTIYVAI